MLHFSELCRNIFIHVHSPLPLSRYAHSRAGAHRGYPPSTMQPDFGLFKVGTIKGLYILQIMSASRNIFLETELQACFNVLKIRPMLPRFVRINTQPEILLLKF